MRPRLRRFISWFAPGLGVKRWVVAMAGGLLLLAAGVMLMANVRPLGWLDITVYRIAVSVLTLSRGVLSPLELGTAMIVGGLAVVFWSLRGAVRSEERRVGKECRSRWSPYH